MSEILHYQVDSSSGVPAYRQIMDQVRYYVASGALGAGDKLPSIRNLAKRLRVNPTTITKAYSELQHAGIVELVQGKGVFVAESQEAAGEREAVEELRRYATPLAEAAREVGADFEVASRILQEEMSRLAGAEAEPQDKPDGIANERDEA